MSRFAEFIDFAERTYSIDWTAIQRAVHTRLGLTSSFDGSVYDPERHPAYWCVPVLVGSYVGASERSVLADTEAFVSGCVIRHCMFDPVRPFDESCEDLRPVADAFHGCHVGSDAESSFEARFTAKCLPWRVLLTAGTRAIADEAGDRADYAAAMRAIVRVYSCLQVVDDWHDRDEDAARSHWNMWLHEPPRAGTAVIEPLLRGSRAGVEGLRPHPLRTALAVQLEDTVAELRQVVHERRNGGARRHEGGLDEAIAAGIAFLRRSLEAGGLWRDFELPGVSAGSTECVSAFVAAQIGAVPEGRELAGSVVASLADRARETGGWGYREDVPEDCDTTAWVLLAAAAAGVELPRSLVERSTGFIAGHQDRDGGFVTYGPAAKASLTPADQPGWFAPEVAVTASAVLALAATEGSGTERVRRACRFILRARRDGLWSSYWWSGFGYATYHSLLAVSSGPYEAQPAATAQAILMRRGGGGWADGDGEPVSGFSTSFALRALLLAGEPSAAGRAAIGQAAAYLSGLVSDAGAAPPSAEMLAPGAATGSDLVLRDTGRVTTAAVIRALHDARASGVTPVR